MKLRRRKLLVASVGVAAVSYVIAACATDDSLNPQPLPPQENNPPVSGNLPSPPPPEVSAASDADAGDSGDASDAASGDASDASSD